MFIVQTFHIFKVVLRRSGHAISADRRDNYKWEASLL